MSRILLGAALILALVVAESTPTGPRNLSDILNGRWKQQPSLHRHPRDHVQNATITQRVDNFNAQNEATYEQRYFYIDEHFRAGGPLYVIFNDLSYASEYLIEYSLVHEMARNDSGSVFLLENRFYGESVATADLSIENLRFLTIEQSLVDAAHFVHHIKTTIPGAENSPVVVVGESYGGSMAVWFRQKYPHLSVGAWASSAPLLALQNNQQFKENAGLTIRNLAGDECYNNIEAGFRQLEAMAIDRQFSELHKLLNVCPENSIDSEENMATLFLIISEFFSSISTFRQKIPEICGVLAVFDVPAEAIAYVIQSQFEAGCVPVEYDNLVELERDIDVSSSYAYYGLRQSTYQRCTQLGGFTTSDSPNQPFGSLYPLAYFTKFCTSVLDEEVANHVIVHENQDRFNVKHGGLNPSINNAIYTYGELDPQQSLGLTQSVEQNEATWIIQVPNAGHSYDFFELEASLTDEIRYTKHRIVDVIRSWIQ